MNRIFNFLSIVILQLISLTYVHEIGHSFFANIEGCESKSLIYDNSLISYTIVSCKKTESLLIFFGGLVFTLLFSLIFICFGIEYFLLAISISLLLALEDLSMFVNNFYIVAISSVCSFLSYFLIFEKIEREKISTKNKAFLQDV